MASDEVVAFEAMLSAHRATVVAAAQVEDHVDVVGALEVHAGLARLLRVWEDFNVTEQRAIVRTIEHVVNLDDDHPDLAGPDGFRDDLAELHDLEAFLGYVEVPYLG